MVDDKLNDRKLSGNFDIKLVEVMMKDAICELYKGIIPDDYVSKLQENMDPLRLECLASLWQVRLWEKECPQQGLKYKNGKLC